jgi:hypothetical protein
MTPVGWSVYQPANVVTIETGTLPRRNFSVKEDFPAAEEPENVTVLKH